MKKWVARNGCVVRRILSGRSNVFMVSDGNNHLLVDTSVKICMLLLRYSMGIDP